MEAAITSLIETATGYKLDRDSSPGNLRAFLEDPSISLLVARPNESSGSVSATIGYSPPTDKLSASGSSAGAGLVSELHLLKQGYRADGQPRVVLSSVSGGLPASVATHLRHVLASGAAPGSKDEADAAKEVLDKIVAASTSTEKAAALASGTGDGLGSSRERGAGLVKGDWPDELEACARRLEGSGRKGASWATRVTELRDYLISLVSAGRAARPGQATEGSERARDVLDGAWRGTAEGEGLRQADMERLLRAVAFALLEWARVFVGHPSRLWAPAADGAAGDGSAAAPSVRARRCRAAARVLGNWLRTCNELTGVIWATRSAQREAWLPSGAHLAALEEVGDVCRRCRQAFGLRAALDELVRAGAGGGAAAAAPACAFLQAADALRPGAAGLVAWQAALGRFDAGIEGCEAAAGRWLAAAVEGELAASPSSGAHGPAGAAGAAPEGAPPAASGSAESSVTSVAAALAAANRCQHLMQRPRVAALCAGALADAGQAVAGCVRQMDLESQRLEQRLQQTQAAAAGGDSGGFEDAPALCARARSIVSKTEAVERVIGALPQLPAGVRRRLASVRSRAVAAAGAAARSWAGGAGAHGAGGAASGDSDLVSFDAGGNMAVGVSNRDLRESSDTRRMAELGVPLSEAALGSLASLEAKHRHLVALKKVSAFYNSLGSIIVPCTKPLLLRPLVQFEEAVGRASKLRVSADGGADRALWGAVDELQQCAQRVSSSNRVIRTGHSEVAKVVCGMFSADLAQQGREGFLESLGRVRELVARTLRDVGLVSRDSQATSVLDEAPAAEDWLKHWDMQIYKALEAPFRLGLESLNESLPDIRCDVVVSRKTGALITAPPFEELRAQYYRALKRFVVLPSEIDPLHPGSRAMYTRMASRNNASLVQVYRKAEFLFARLSRRLEQLRGAWEHYGAFFASRGGVEDQGPLAATLRSLLNPPRTHSHEGTATATSSDDAPAPLQSDRWVAALQLVRRLKREVGEVPDSERVHCVRLNLGPLRHDLEDAVVLLAEHLADAMLSSLGDTLGAVEQFLSASVATLSRRPSTLAELEQAQVDRDQIRKNSPAMLAALKSVEDSRKVSATILSASGAAGGQRKDGLDRVKARLRAAKQDWRQLDQRVAAFDGLIGEQREEIAARLREDVAAFGQQCSSLESRWGAVKPGAEVVADPELGGSGSEALWYGTSYEGVLSQMQSWEEQAATLTKRADELQSSCDAFSIDFSGSQTAQHLSVAIHTYFEDWQVLEEWRSELRALTAGDWVSFRPKLFELGDLAEKWTKDDRVAFSTGGSNTGGSAGGGISEPVRRIQLESGWVQAAMPGLKLMKGESFQTQHWAKAFACAQLPPSTRIDSLAASELLEGPALRRLSDPNAIRELKALVSQAQGEITIRETLNESRAWLESARFVFSEYESPADGVRVPVIKAWRELFADLGDQLSVVASLKDSPFFNSFADAASSHEVRLVRLMGLLQQLQQLQRKWVYLQPVFGAGSLPSELPRFRRVDGAFQPMMTSLHKGTRVLGLLSLGDYDQQLKELTGYVSALERCQKALSDFLETKRQSMPRFYFIGDEDLLELLGQSKRIDVVHAHLKKLFQGIQKVRTHPEDPSSIVAVCASSSETLGLGKAVSMDAPIETWLGGLARSSADALASDVLSALESRRALRQPVDAAADGSGLECHPLVAEQLERFTGQALSVADQLLFCDRANAALASEDPRSALRQLQSSLSSELKALTMLRREAGRVQLLKLKGVLLDTIHSAEVCAELIKSRAQAPSDWAWQKQLRFDMVPATLSLFSGRQESLEALAVEGLRNHSVLAGVSCPSLVEAHMATARAAYTYEYQGNAARLVHTPLTDRCYITLTQALSLGYGGNPYGPAGTGKTESVKALGGQLGRQVLVFNCDEGIDFRSMGRIFTGLVQSGAWGCFDEFNRLLPDQLSAISQQIQTIQTAIKRGEAAIELLGRRLAVDADSGIFVTLNPAGKGYGGRSKLPDNLKQLFRPVAMSKPDLELIAEVLLFAEGFMSAKDISKRLVSLFTLSRELLSKQSHYDWGLRAMRTCLNTAGRLLSLREEPCDREQEAELLIQAVRINILSKLSASDAAAFIGILGDVFPGVRSSDLQLDDVMRAIRSVVAGDSSGVPDGGIAIPASGAGADVRENSASPPPDLADMVWDETQAKKVLQLYESLGQRIGCVVVGPAGSGKSSLWRILRRALEVLGFNIELHVINPKAMARSELLGRMDHDTREFHDGVLTTAARAAAKGASEGSTDGVRKAWVVLDGDVDPEWIESLNSVLDDNRLLTLPSGERISFGDHVNFIFETHDLQHASPATISRMGIIFLSDEDVDVSRLLESWQSSVTADGHVDAALLSTSLDEVLVPAVESFRTLPLDAMLVRTTVVGAVESSLSQIRGLLLSSGDAAGTVSPSPAVVALGCIRGLGGSLRDESSRRLASNIIRNARLECAFDPRYALLDDTGMGLRKPVAFDPELPGEGDDTWERVRQGKQFLLTTSGQVWRDTVACWLMNDGFGRREPAARLAGSGSASGSATKAQQRPILLAGPPGCGKGAMIRSLASAFHSTVVAQFNCTAGSGPNDLADALRRLCNVVPTSEGAVLRPKASENLIMLIKDLNVSKPDKWGTAIFISFLQQIASIGGFFARDGDFLRVDLARIFFVGTVVPSADGSGGGRHELSTRLTGAMRTCKVNLPDAEELNGIVSCYSYCCNDMLHSEARVLESIRVDRLVPAMVSTWIRVSSLAAEMVSSGGLSSAAAVASLSPRTLHQWVFSLLKYGPYVQQSTAMQDRGDAQSVWAACISFEARMIYLDRFAPGGAADSLKGAVSELTSQLRSGSGSDHADGVDGSVAQSFVSLPVSVLANASESEGDGAVMSQAGAAQRNGGQADWVSQTGAKRGPTDDKSLAKALRRLVRLLSRDDVEVDVSVVREVVKLATSLDYVIGSCAPAGHALLVGSAGVGRKEVLRLVAHAHGGRWFEPLQAQRFSRKQLRSTFVDAILHAAVNGECAVLYIDESSLVAESPGFDTGVTGVCETLELANSLVSSADEAAQLFTQDELGTHLKTMAEHIESEAESTGGLTPINSPDDQLVAFRSRLSANLHIVVSLNPAARSFVPAVLANPALSTKATVVWAPDWQATSVALLPRLLLPAPMGGHAQPTDDEIGLGFGGGTDAATPSSTALVVPQMSTEGSKNLRKTLMRIFKDLKSEGSPLSAAAASARRMGQTLVAARQVYFQMARSLTMEASHLDKGLRKLSEAETVVDKLTRDVEESRGKLEAKQRDADAAMDEITKALEIAAGRKQEVEGLRKKSGEAEAAAKEREEQIEGQLADIRPKLEEAKSAVGNVSAENLRFVSSLGSPPTTVCDILEAVLKLLGVGDTSWHSMRRFLRKRGVVDEILNYDPRRATPDVQAKVREVLRKKAASFQPDRAYSASAAVGPLAAWVQATLDFSQVLRTVQPLEREYDAAKVDVQRAQEALASNEAELQKLDARVKELQGTYRGLTAQAETLRIQLQAAEATLQRASTLLSKLSGESTRWRQRMEAFGAKMQALPVSALLSGLASAVLGNVSEVHRRALLAQWESCAIDHGLMQRASAEDSREMGFDFRSMLTTETQVAGWKRNGLPADSLSLDNGLIIFSLAAARLVPFVVDPDGAALGWLSAQLSAQSRDIASGKTVRTTLDGPSGPVEAVGASDQRLQLQFELGLKFGKTLVVRNCRDVPALFHQLLRNDRKTLSGRPAVSVGEKLVEVSQTFRMVLFCRDSSIELSPFQASLVQRVDFTVTSTGLSGQLLSSAIRMELPELEAKKSVLLERQEQLKSQLADMEQSLISTLASAGDDILENDPLVQSLTETKQQSIAIEAALLEGNTAEQELDRQRMVYHPLATAGSRVFFAVQALHSQDPTYQFSLQWFQQIFRATIGEMQSKSSSAKERLDLLIPALSRNTVADVGRTVKSSHRVMAALIISRAAFPEAVPDQQWRLVCGISSQLSATGAPSGALRQPTWLPASAASQWSPLWHSLGSKADRVFASPGEWERWVRGEVAGDGPAGMPTSAVQLNPFDAVAVASVLRPELLVQTVDSFLSQVTAGGQPISLSASNDFGALAAQSTSLVPIVLITSSGADPTAELRLYADAKIKASSGAFQFIEIAMGGDAQDRVLDTVREAAGRGDWVCLKNVHLVAHWLPELERFVLARATEASHLSEKPAELAKSSGGSGAASASAGGEGEGFRLWLSTESHQDLPKLLLQQSLKVSFEPSPGLASSLQRVLKSLGPDVFQSDQAVGPQLMFVLTWLHAIVQERREFIPQGWTKHYEFSVADLRAGQDIIGRALLEAKNDPTKVPWQQLHGLLTQVAYGGRLDNVYDQKILQTFVRASFSAGLLRGGKSLARGVPMLDRPSFDAATSIVGGIPLDAPPSMLRLPDNVSAAQLQAQAEDLRVNLRDYLGSAKAGTSVIAQTGVSSSSKLSDEDSALLDACVAEWHAGSQLSELVGATVDTHSAKRKGVPPDPLSAFVQGEIRICLAASRRIHGDLHCVRAFLESSRSGTGRSSREYPAEAVANGRDIAFTMTIGRIPGSWLALWDPDDHGLSLDRASGGPVLGFIRELAIRREALLGKWKDALKAGVAQQLFSGKMAVDIRELMRPATLLDSLRQHTARQTKSDIAHLDLQAVFGRDPLQEAQASVGMACPVLIHGSKAVGVVFSGPGAATTEASLAAGSDAVTSTVPSFAVGFVAAIAGKKRDGTGGIDIPVYVSASRQRLWAEVAIPVAGSSTGDAK